MSPDEFDTLRKGDVVRFFVGIDTPMTVRLVEPGCVHVHSPALGPHCIYKASAAMYTKIEPQEPNDG